MGAGAPMMRRGPGLVNIWSDQLTVPGGSPILGWSDQIRSTAAQQAKRHRAIFVGDKEFA